MTAQSGGRDGRAGGPSTVSAARSTTRLHHPHRLEVRGVTPVSVLFLWSLRPPPVSAIPRNGKWGRTTKAAHGKASSTAKHSPSVPRSAESSHVTATRGPNRKVTKVTLRNASPSKQSTASRSAAPASSRLSPHSHPSPLRNDGEEWSYEHAVAAAEQEESREEAECDVSKSADTPAAHDDEVDGSEGSEDLGLWRAFDSGISVLVNDVPWSHVVMGDGSGADEAFIVVYGLSPCREYEMLLNVEGKQASFSVATLEKGECIALPHVE